MRASVCRSAGRGRRCAGSTPLPPAPWPRPRASPRSSRRGASGRWRASPAGSTPSSSGRGRTRRCPHPRPVWLYVGRVAPEKSVEDFLELELEGSKVVVGDGPDRERLERDHPDAVFLGTLRGEELARAYAAADVLVFPSRTDTFGLVVLEALASGTPVAAYPVTGPLDIIGDSGAGVLDEDLGRAARAALAIPREHARRHALGFSWQVVARQFVAALEPIARSAGSTMPAAPAAARRQVSAGTPRAGG
jgi:glycosyltransferase involved in cell wall biosynthesis